jgi:uncharacterized protein (TIGR02466 family)
MEIIEIFKQPIFKIKLNENLKTIIDFSKKLEKNTGRTLSNVGGFQSKDLDLNEPVLTSLIKNITEYSNLFLNNHLQINKNLNLINIWLNINYFKDFNLPHIHSFSKISGVFYVKTPKNCGNINFINDSNLRAFISSDLITNYNNYNSSKWSFIPEENILYLFPSWFNHYVEPNLSKDKRISISFNLN